MYRYTPPDRRKGHGGGSSSSSITLPLDAAFDIVNLLSAPRVEHERAFYCIENKSRRWCSLRDVGPGSWLERAMRR